MRATISTAPTPFDGCTREELHEWLTSPVTEKLIASLKEHIKELEGYMLDPNQAVLSDADLGSKLRTMLVSRADRLMLLEWILGANRA